MMGENIQSIGPLRNGRLFLWEFDFFHEFFVISSVISTDIFCSILLYFY